MVKVAVRVSRYSRVIKKQLRDIVKEAGKRAGRVVAHVLELGHQLVPQLLVDNRHLALWRNYEYAEEYKGFVKGGNLGGDSFVHTCRVLSLARKFP